MACRSRPHALTASLPVYLSTRSHNQDMIPLLHCPNRIMKRALETPGILKFAKYTQPLSELLLVFFFGLFLLSGPSSPPLHDISFCTYIALECLLVCHTDSDSMGWTKSSASGLHKYQGRRRRGRKGSHIINGPGERHRDTAPTVGYYTDKMVIYR